MNSDWFVLKFSGYNRAKDISVTTCEVLQQDSKPKLYKCINDNDDNNAIQISNEASQKLILNQDGFYKVRLYIYIFENSWKVYVQVFIKVIGLIVCCYLPLSKT